MGGNRKAITPSRKRRRFPVFWLVLFASILIGGALMLGLKAKSISLPAHKQADVDYTISTPTAPTEENKIASANNNVDQATTTNTLTEHPAFSNSSESNVTAASLSKSAAKHLNHNSLHASTKSTKSSTPAGRNKLQSEVADEVPRADFNSSVGINSMPSSASRRTTHLTSFLPGIETEELTSADYSLPGMLSIKPDPSCYRFSGITGRYLLSADFFGGPGFSPRSFNFSGPEASVYKEARQSTESHQYAWSAGARLNLQLHNGFGFKIGMMYDQAGDIFDYTDTLATQSTTRIDSFFSADGTFLYADTNRVLIIGTLIQKIHNTYRHLDVPILFSYEMPLGRAIVMINAGPVFNLSASHEGEILDPMLHPRSITPGSTQRLDVYKTSLGLSFYLGAGALFPLTDHISALVEPRYLYRIKPVTIKSYPLEEHRHFASLNLGLRYYFD